MFEKYDNLAYICIMMLLYMVEINISMKTFFDEIFCNERLTAKVISYIEKCFILKTAAFPFESV